MLTLIAISTVYAEAYFTSFTLKQKVKISNVSFEVYIDNVKQSDGGTFYWGTLGAGEHTRELSIKNIGEINIPKIILVVENLPTNFTLSWSANGTTNIPLGGWCNGTLTLNIPPSAIPNMDYEWTTYIRAVNATG